MRQLFILIVALTAFRINAQPQLYSYKSDPYFGVTIYNNGPRGIPYTDPAGTTFQFRIFRVRIVNDTIIPIELTVNFPGDSVALLPKSEKRLRVFLFPERMSPSKVEEVYNYGVTGLESFLDTVLNNPTTRKVMILPGQDHYLYIGELFSGEFIGLARSRFFINGQNIDAPFLPVQSIKNDTKDKSKLDFIFGVAIDPPDYYSLIPCGQIVFKK